MGARRAVGALLLPMAILAGGVASASTPSASSSPAPRVLFHLQDPRIDEASGLGVGVRSRGIDYVENDSGDSARFFALDARTGATAAVVTVPGATNVDWEDLQVAPDPAGRSSVWLADIGDNGADRNEIDVYRVREPSISRGDDDLSVRSGRPAIWRLRYPGGPTDAESLAVTPRGRAFVITKSVLGLSDVYAVPARPDASRVRTLSRIGSIEFGAASGRSPIGSAGSVLATSAAVSPDGRLLAVRTYVYADVWRLHPDGDRDGIARALQTTPTRVALPAERQGEGLAFAGDRLLLDSEGVGTPVWSVPLPAALLTAATTPSETATSTASSSTAPSSTASSSTASGGTASPRPTPTGVPTRRRGGIGGASIVVFGLLALGLYYQVRRARRHGRNRRG